MSTKELAYNLIDKLSENQLKGLLMLLQEYVNSEIEEVEPDEWELQMIAESEADDSEPMPIEDYAKGLGIDYDSL